MRAMTTLRIVKEWKARRQVCLAQDQDSGSWLLKRLIGLDIRKKSGISERDVWDDSNFGNFDSGYKELIAKRGYGWESCDNKSSLSTWDLTTRQERNSLHFNSDSTKSYCKDLGWIDMALLWQYLCTNSRLQTLPDSRSIRLHHYWPFSLKAIGDSDYWSASSIYTSIPGRIKVILVCCKSELLHAAVNLTYNSTYCDLYPRQHNK